MARPPVLPPDFFDTPQFRAAFASREMGQVLRVYRTDPRHWSVHGRGGIGQEVLGAWLGLTQVQVSRMETGKVVPKHLDTLIHYARTLHLPQGLLWFDLPNSSRLSAATADHGELLRVTGAPLPEPVSRAVDKPWNAGPEALDALTAALAATRRLEDTTSAAAVLPTVDHHVRIVDTFAREARSAHRHKAAALASELHTYRGWLAIDTHDFVGAETHLRAGTALAVECGGHNLLAESLGFSARREWLLGNYVAAVSLREASLDHARSTATRVIYGLLLAQALASSQDRAGSDRALLAVDRLFDRFDEAELDDWLYYCTKPFMIAFRGSVHAIAGRKHNAVADLTDGLNAMPTDHRNAEWAREYRERLAELA